MYEISASSFGSKVGEFLKGIVLLLGRDDARHLTAYVVGTIEGAEGLHLPLYGSVFLGPGTPDTTLAHELGHALRSVGNTYHLHDAAQPVARLVVGTVRRVALPTMSGRRRTIAGKWILPTIHPRQRVKSSFCGPGRATGSRSRLPASGGGGGDRRAWASRAADRCGAAVGRIGGDGSHRWRPRSAAGIARRPRRPPCPSR